MARFKPVRVKKTLTLAQVAQGLSTDVIGAIYSGVGRTQVDNLAVGDELEDVVDQQLSRHGFSEIDDKLSQTRLQIQIGADVTGSMWGGSVGRSIVPAMYMMRIFNQAMDTVMRTLPQSVFKSHLWFWGMKGGNDIACLTDPEQGTRRLCWKPNPYAFNTTTQYLSSVSHANYQASLSDPNFKGLNAGDVETLDAALVETAASRPGFMGSATYLAPMLTEWQNWENKYGDSQAHRLDIVITDGQLYDWQECGNIQSDRRNGGKYEGVILQVADIWVSNVPQSMTMYRVHAHTLESTVRDLLLDFVRRIF